MQFLLDISIDKLPGGLSELFILKSEINLHLSGDDYEFISWGDPICTDTFRIRLHSERSIEFIVNHLSGHYYYIFYDMNNHQFLIGNSLFSILPIYYYNSNNRLILSDNAFSLGRHMGMTTLSKRFVLESQLFNYPLFNHSVIDGISLLPSNSGMVFDRSGVKIIKHTSIEKLFCQNPLPLKKSVGRLTESFLEVIKKYLPEENYFTALTGGFDGRTLTAAGRYHGKSFTCYCFGTTASDDLKLASEIAFKAGIPFLPIELGNDYLRSYSLDAGKEFIIRSSGTGTFARAHYIFSVRQLADRTKYLVTGNFGSEIFRAVHVPGVIISPDLYALFMSENPEQAYQKLLSSTRMKYLNQAELGSVLADLKSDIACLPCFNSQYGYLTRNQQFYIFVFEELFRKYFGAEMISQAGYLNNRTPFLDIDFLKQLMETEFAGIHSGFFEENPFKRYKGQVLYANIIRKAFPQLGKMLTDKGYKPDDLISVTGKSRIIAGYMGKRLKRKAGIGDPNGVRSAWELNRSHYENLPVKNNLFKIKNITDDSNSGLTDNKAKIFSLIYSDNYLDKLMQTDG